GFGLAGMRKRVAEIGGEFTVDSVASEASGGSGTVVAVSVPIRQSGAARPAVIPQSQPGPTRSA
ncbi:hypothetical protein, partial [Cereibacter sphaeroides]|uniref:hypothetical protein n=1 Tax=Cereibacter sphaeroides TaxID=1063 RepID=UPI00196143AC